MRTPLIIAATVALASLAGCGERKAEEPAAVAADATTTDAAAPADATAAPADATAAPVDATAAPADAPAELPPADVQHNNTPPGR